MIKFRFPAVPRPLWILLLASLALLVLLASFFVRAAAGQYDLERPEQLRALLMGMVRNKLAFQLRKQRAQRRDHRRLGKDLDLFSIADETGAGLILWHPKGGFIRIGLDDDLESCARRKLAWTVPAATISSSYMAPREATTSAGSSILSASSPSTRNSSAR